MKLLFASESEKATVAAPGGKQAMFALSVYGESGSRQVVERVKAPVCKRMFAEVSDLAVVVRAKCSL